MKWYIILVPVLLISNVSYAPKTPVYLTVVNTFEERMRVRNEYRALMRELQLIQAHNNLLQKRLYCKCQDDGQCDDCVLEKKRYDRFQAEAEGRTIE